MVVKKIKRICDVRGCRNMVAYNISANRQIGNSVIICEDCLRSALKAVEHYNDDDFNKYKPTTAPPLFFNDVSDDANNVAEADEDISTDHTDIDDSTEYSCNLCDKKFKTESGLHRHISVMHGGDSNV